MVIINGKGGVGKTSLAANVAGQLAKAGGRVLAVDLDLSGNLQLDLGYVGHEQDDAGKGQVDAVFQNTPFNIIRDVRDGLDVIPGGRQLDLLVALSYTGMASELTGGGVHPAFAARLAEIAGDYDIVIIDGAPGNSVLQDMALTAGRYILIPTRTDSAGWEGLRMVGPRVKKVRPNNPALTYLGVVLFAHATNATRILSNTRARLDEVSETVGVLDSYIRHSETAAHDCRSRGQLAHELAADATQNHRDRLTALHGRHDGTRILPPALSGSANSLADDYQNLAREVMVRINEIEHRGHLSTVGG